MSQSPQALTRINKQTPGDAASPPARNEPASNPSNYDLRNDEISSLKKHYADDDLESTETRVLHEEGEQLSKLLKKAFPNENRDTWTYTDLEDAVQKSRSAWESKERLGSGKPQKLFHSLMRKFDAHSNLFQFIPSGNLYASLVTGATAILVKASVNHSKSIEELSDALDAITEAVSIGDVESNLIKSKAMQSAVAKLYIAIFLFFGDAATWYKSSAASKVVHSLHKNFSERFRTAISKIQDLAANVRYIAQLGSQAEVRVVRLEVAGLQDELQDFRVGMSGALRQLADQFAQRLSVQHGENMQQHERTQVLLSNYQSAGMLPAPPVVERDYQRLVQSTERLALSEVASTSIADSEDRFDVNADEEESERHDKTSTIVKQLEQLGIQLSLPDAETRYLNHGNLFDRHLAQAVNQWLAKPAASLLYLENITSTSGDDTILALTQQIIRSCNIAGTDSVPLHLEWALALRRPCHSPSQSLVILLIYLAYHIQSRLGESTVPLSAEWQSTGPIENVPMGQAASMLASVIESCVKDLLYIAIPGHRFLANLDPGDLECCLKAFRSMVNRPSSRVKIIILTPVRLPETVSFLEPHELVLLRQQTSKKFIAKIPIVCPSS